MIEKVDEQVAQIKTYIDSDDRKDPNVSKSGTYWHSDHALNVINEVTRFLEQSNPSDYKPKFSFLKFVIMTFGYMPRGKARAPKQTVRNDEITQESLNRTYQKALESIEKLKLLPDNKAFRHPMFGWMQKKDTIKFLKIHTHHHIKILNDIGKS
ncbi:MAG: hypothetical protein WBG46_06180 [Nonlabens sp.]